MNEPGYSLTDGRFWRIVGYNWTPDEREVFDRWYANDWAKADEALRIALAASNNPQADSDELRRRLGWFLDG